VFARDRERDASGAVREHGSTIVDGDCNMKATRIAKPFHRLIIKALCVFQVFG
jgi:hypothetical protein